MKINKKKSVKYYKCNSCNLFIFTQSSINLEKDDVILGDNNNMKRAMSENTTKKQVKKDKVSISSHVESILKN